MHQKCSDSLVRVNKAWNSFAASLGFWIWNEEVYLRASLRNGNYDSVLVRMWQKKERWRSRVHKKERRAKGQTSWSPRWGYSLLWRNHCCGLFSPRLYPLWTRPFSRNHCAPPGSWTVWKIHTKVTVWSVLNVVTETGKILLHKYQIILTSDVPLAKNH